MPSLKTALFSICTLAALASLSGCNKYVTGGNGFSDDTHVYESTPGQPMTVILRDWTTNTEIFSWELPVGRKLVVQFFPDRFPNNPNKPDLMRWEEMPATQTNGSLNNEQAVCSKHARRFDSYVREPGELAPGARNRSAANVKPAPTALPD